jgi:broad specificity phosphatase PhoE
VLILVRHGATEWSATGRHTGRTDVPLTADGEAQARAVGRWLDDIVRGRARLVLCSPKARAVRTAELAGLTPFELDEDLVEWDYGDYEGLTSEQIHRSVPGWTVFSEPCPNGETAQAVARRCDRVLALLSDRVGEEAIVDYGRTAVAVVLVSHGHLLRSLAARWLGREVPAGAELELGTAAICLLGSEHRTHTLRRWNLPNPGEPAADL